MLKAVIKALAIWCMLLPCACILQAQVVSYLRNTVPVVMPFDYQQHFIVVQVRVGGLPLKFIVDTGAEHTLLLKKEISDVLGMSYSRRLRLLGADLDTEIYAQLVLRNSLQLGDNCLVTTDLVVLEEDFRDIDQLIGSEIHGVLGASVLRHFVVKIDYQRQELTLIPPRQFTAPPSRFERLPIRVQRGKPYLTSVLISSDLDSVQVKLLIDSGAALSGLIYATVKNRIEIPQSYVTGRLGAGLGGHLTGYIGKVHSLAFGPFVFRELITSFQDIRGKDTLLFDQGRDGIAGNVLLSRFTVYIDYERELLYLKPNRSYKKKIRYDRSGLVLVSTGSEFDQIMVLDIISGSPAEEAGIRPGDRILSFQGWKVRWPGFNRINRKLSGKEGKKIRMQISREGKKQRVSFRLRNLI